MQVSIDVGGTFTDFVIVDEDVEHYKVPSTPEAPENAVIQGLDRKDIEGEVFHGSTVATNTFLEREGAETVFITNEGFKDILFIGRQDRPELYDLNFDKLRPPLDEENCFEVPGRVKANGEIKEGLDEERVEAIAEDIEERDVCAAVCLLHSYVNPIHEVKIGDILKERDIEYSLSSRVSGEFREYERGMTTLLDAYISPKIKDYFKRVVEGLEKEPLIMKSSGGLERSSTVSPVDTLYSGPAGGVAGGDHVSELLDIKDIVTFDMGGTSADISTIIDGEISWKDQGEIGGYPIQSRMVDLVTIGSGGGSIAWRDRGGALRVGPKSAGADPGPVCYGRGGERPTITDSLLLMGYIDPDFFLGGKMELDKERARASLEELSDEVGMGFEETLRGIFKVANSKMARGIKRITIERGLNPERFSLLAFGGAGPLHAVYLAEELGIDHVVIPKMPGVFSALGMITGDQVKDFSKTIMCPLCERKRIEKEIDDLRDDIDVEPDREENIILGLRYSGQSFHMNIPYVHDIEDRFHREHEKKYGYCNREDEVEVVRIHIEMRKEREKKDITFSPQSVEHPRNRSCLFDDGYLDTDIYLRKGLETGFNCRGPTVIEDIDSTILVPPNWTCSVDRYGFVHIEDMEAEI